MATERGIKTDDSMGKRVIIDAIQKASSPPDKAAAAKADATKKEA
jgi:hypothetical protein